MSVRVAIVTDPFDPSGWTEHETDDFRALMVETFPTWPDTARIYDLEGFGDWRRAGSVTDSAVLKRRDVTPRDEAGVERLAELPGPLLVIIPPADPITAIITVVAIIVAVVATFLLMPKMPSINNDQPSSNNSLGQRANKARPNARIPDIFGTVRSIPDLLTTPYKLFVNNLEQEISYMCIGRGEYSISDVRDGDTPFASISGGGAQFYGPGTSPNSGTPQLTIGTPITDPVLSVSKVEAVNGQTLRPPNANYFRGDNNIRFIAPDTIERTGTGKDFTTLFATDDELTVGNADFGGQTEWLTILKSAKFYPDKTIVFDGPFDPSTVFIVGQQVALTNAVLTGLTTGGAPVTVDLSGNYVVASVNSTTLGLA